MSPVIIKGELATESNAWINTANSRNQEVIAKAQRILITNIYCTLSTCSADGFPWASPVLFAYDDGWNLYWASTTASKHSQNIYRNSGRIAVAVYNSNTEEGTGSGLYFYGFAAEVGTENTDWAMHLLFKRAGKNLNRIAQDYLDDSPRRIYRFQPQSAWITGFSLPVGNQLIDTKIKVALPQLNQVL